MQNTSAASLSNVSADRVSVESGWNGGGGASSKAGSMMMMMAAAAATGTTAPVAPSPLSKNQQHHRKGGGGGIGQSVCESTAAAAAHSIYMADLSATDDEDDSEVEPFPLGQDDVDQESMFETPKFLLSGDGSDSPDLQSVDPETQARLEALLEAAGIGRLSTADGKHLADPEMLRKLTSSVSCALDEAAAALSRMKAESANQLGQSDMGSLADACNDGDAGAVKKLLEEGRSVNETTEEGDSLLSLACQAGYYELAQVLLAMRANVEDRGIKGDCTPLMEAASAGHVDIVKLLVSHGADVNAQSSSGNTPLMYACAGGHEEVVRGLLKAGANVEDHNENGHTPLMEAASAGHVGVAKILLEHGAGVNTHSNEFKESALTLACYKGHLEMVRFLLEAGADQEHKTDEMHTALMEASMDGHVEVARLLLDSGAQVNMPADSFESPLTLAACGGHVELAMLLLERGANIEEVNDEGYTPLMEAAREGHEEMVALLLSQGADINAQTEETQETALTLACCGGFLEVADFLIKAGADIELGASTPLMEAAQEGRLELVKYLLTAGGNAHACTQTGDTALTYACENGHTDVADLLLQAGADLVAEHESEGGRTPLMKAARAGHVCTVQFLISRGSDVNRQTSNNDHTPLSLACAGGHLVVVELLLAHGANPTHRLKDNSTMLIEAAKGGHTSVVQLLLDYPHNLVATSTPPDLSQLSTPTFDVAEAHRVPPHGMPHPTSVEADPSAAQAFYHNLSTGIQSVGSNKQEQKQLPPQQQQQQQQYLCTSTSTDVSVQPVDTLTTAELQQVKNPPPPPPPPHLPSGFPPDIGFDFEGALVAGSSDISLELDKDVKPCERLEACINNMMKKAEQLHHNREEQILQKQQILEELQRVERELQEKAQAQLLMNAQAQLRIEQQHGSPPSCSLSGSSSLLEMSQNLTTSVAAADGQFGGVTFKSPNILPPHQQETKLSPLATGILSSCLVDAATSLSPSNVSTVPSSPVSPSEMLALTTVKAIMKKESGKGGSTELLKPQLPPLELIEEMGKLNIGTDTFMCGGTEPTTYLGSSTEQVFLSNNTKQQTCLEHSLADRMIHTSTACVGTGIGAGGGAGLTSISDIVTSSQVQSQDSAVVSVGHHSFQSPSSSSLTTTTTSSTGVLQPPEEMLLDAASKNLKSITQIKNHLNSVTVNTCSVMGNIPLSSAGAVPQLPCNQQQQQVAALSQQQQHYVPTSTVATQYIDPSLSSSALSLPLIQPTAATTAAASSQVSLQSYPPLIDVNSQTDSNHDTALTLACAGGHEELVQLLLARGADIGMKFEHRDKKGFTPLILAATAGHVRVVDILLNHGADIEAQSERTKDTPLSLACSGGRHDVVESLLNRGANKEHRNVSDYTPLSLAASGGYVNIIKLLLNHGAEINSRTGSKLGISPLMLAAMNGHTQAVKLLLDMGSDINAQIETNRNTALTLACFQGRNEVVSLLVDRKANVEHRAKTGLTPLMEAASGGYVEVGRVLLDKGADVNAPPVPSSRDTALTIAADKGHYHFVELLLSRGAQVDVKNKKGNSPMWLAANGGHLDVVKLLLSTGADIDSQDNRKVSCLMAAFRKGHIKVVKWMVKHVTQFPSDQEMGRYLATFNDDELHDKCNQCLDTIRAAKDCQAVEANKNASTLLEELNNQKAREESKKAAAVKRREQKRKKKKEKLDKKVGSDDNEPEDQPVSRVPDMEARIPLGLPTATLITTVSLSATLTSTTNKPLKQIIPVCRNMDVVAQSSATTGNDYNNSVVSLNNNNNKSKLKMKTNMNHRVIESSPEPEPLSKETNGIAEAQKKLLEMRIKERQMEAKQELNTRSSKETKSRLGITKDKTMTPANNKVAAKSKLNVTDCVAATVTMTTTTNTISTSKKTNAVSIHSIGGSSSKLTQATNAGGSLFSSSSSTSSNSSSSSSTLLANDKKRDQSSQQQQQQQQNNLNSSIISLDDYRTMTFVSNSRSAVKSNKKAEISILRNTPGLSSSIKAVSTTSLSPKKGAKREEGWKEVVRNDTRSRTKKVIVPANAISRVIGRGGCNINTIREVSGATIEVEKQKGAGDRNINIKGSAEAMRQAHLLINMMVKDPEKDLSELIPANKKMSASSKLVLVGQNVGATQLLMSGLQPKTTSATSILKSGNLPGLFSTSAFPTQPPFSAPVRQPSAVRPGMAMSPAFPSTSSWPAFPVPSSISTSKKSAGSAASSSSSSSVASQSDGSSSLVAAGSLKTSAARQLFPQEKKGTTSTGTGTKTTVSYTVAVSGNGRAAKTVSSNSIATFAAKVTESRSGSASSTGVAATTANKSANKTPGGGGGSRANNNNNQPTLQLSSDNGSQTRTSIVNGPVCNSAPVTGSQPSFTSNSQSVNNTVSSSSSTSVNLSISLTRTVSPLSSSRVMATPTAAITQDYSPFNNLFSNVAQQSVWGKERDDSKGMNFASVAAANVKSSSSGICSSNSMNSSLNGIPPPPPPPPPADASKAPGYRGNAHISPSSSSSMNSNSGGSSGAGIIPGSSSIVGGPISPGSRPRLPNSAPSTPPIGPIAPPVGSSIRKASPPLGVGSASDTIVSLSSSAPATLLPGGPLPPSVIGGHHPHQHPQHHHPFANVPPLNTMQQQQQQQSLLRPSMDLNSSFIQRTSSPGQLVSSQMTNHSYSSATNASTTSTVPSIQSNLNPNAPDFSSRSMTNCGGTHPAAHHLVGTHAAAAQAALHLGRLSSIQDNKSPFSHVNPSSVVFSIQNLAPLVNSVSQSSMTNLGQSGGGGQPLMNPVISSNPNMKHPFQSAPPPQQQQQPPPNLQQQNTNLSSEYPPPLPPQQQQQHLVRHVSASDTLRLVGAVNSHQNMHGSLPHGGIGAAALAHLSQMHPSLSNSLIQSQRNVGVVHSKDDCSNMSPASSPHASNPSSPLAISGMGDHRSFGEDRKLPRPIGTERAHKKTPNYGGMIDCDIFQWRGSFGSSNEHMGPTHDDRLQMMQQQPNYIARFGDNLSSVLENSHLVEANFQVCRPTKSMMSTIHPSGLNSAFPPFLNGMPQQMPQMSQMYTTSAAVGIDIWGNGNNMKPNHGIDIGVQQLQQQQQQQQQPPDNLNTHHLAASGLVSGQMLGSGGGGGGLGVPGSGLGPHQQPSEHKMMWNSWNHMQM